MKRLFVIPVIILGFVIGMSATGHAKWWIFGKSAGRVRINYLYLNKISFDTSIDPGITMFKGNLISGNVIIKGKASTPSGRIGAVEVTLDNKETWRKAELSRGGSFQFVFTPEIDKTYDIFIKVIDTTGKTNDVAATYKKLKVVDTDISGLVRKSLSKLFDAYQQQDPSQFMQYVSPSFEPDESLLDTAIRKDFSTFDLIQIEYLINTVVAGSQGRIYVSLNYNRSVIATKSGDTLTDHGATEFVFAMVKGIPKLVRIKNPLLFGLSDAANVATGTINSGTNDPILLVNEYGDAEEKPFSEAVDIIESGNTFSTSSGGSQSVESGTITVQHGNNTIEGYAFYNDPLADNELEAPGGSGVKEIPGDPGIDTVTTASVTGADADIIRLFGAASTYAVKLNDGKYMLIEHVSGSGPGSVVKYRLQTDGTSSF